MLCTLYWRAFIWNNPSEITHLSGSENICQTKIRRIGPELRVLYNVFYYQKISAIFKCTLQTFIAKGLEMGENDAKK